MLGNDAAGISRRKIARLLEALWVDYGVQAMPKHPSLVVIWERDLKIDQSETLGRALQIIFDDHYIATEPLLTKSAFNLTMKGRGTGSLSRRRFTRET